MANESQTGPMPETLPRRAALTAPLAALLPVPLPVQGPAAQPAARGQGQGGGASPGGGEVAVFSADEIARIRAWFVANPGFRVQPVPPGIARSLARGRPLPPGIARRYAPPSLVGQLRRRSGAEYLIIGGSVVLVQVPGSMVRDIVEDAVGR